jgi:hypothetical protein
MVLVPIVTGATDSSFLSLDVDHSKLLLQIIVPAWLLLEIFFFILIKFAVLPHLQRRVKPADFSNSSYYLKRVLETVTQLKTYDSKSFITGFFCGANIEDIYEGD